MAAQPSRAEIEAHFDGLLHGATTRDEVDRWAAQWGLCDVPEGDDDLMWWALGLLHGIDLRTGPEGEYLHDDDAIAGWLSEFRSQARMNASGEGTPAPG
ncbi:hypothetical protein [Nonomuraea jiangxiensis]|uniref:hypothetical protein n=1 Tax=Nonomuraea jiangxiensis TaxID=633440 RepID=UPI000B8966FC|nr:hypothetical protein [Nonomuraea jiangxiensis]